MFMHTPKGLIVYFLKQIMMSKLIFNELDGSKIHKYLKLIYVQHNGKQKLPKHAGSSRVLLYKVC